MRRVSTSTALRAACVAAAIATAPLLLVGANAGANVGARATAGRHLGTGLSTNYDFARLVLLDAGWPVSANNVTVLTQWLRSRSRRRTGGTATIR